MHEMKPMFAVGKQTLQSQSKTREFRHITVTDTVFLALHPNGHVPPDTQKKIAFQRIKARA